MKKIILLISAFIIIFLSGCKDNNALSSESKSQNQNSSVSQTSQALSSDIYPITPAPKGMSAKKTIEYFFECWKNKDPYGMYSIDYNEKYDPNAIIEFRFTSLSINSLKEETDKEIINKLYSQKWYPNPYSIAFIEVKFNMEINEESTWYNGKNYLEFYLIKATADSDWRIIMGGTG